MSSATPAELPAVSFWRRAARGLFSFRVFVAIGLATATFLTVSGRFNDPDLWWHLKTGQVIWTTGSIPSTDLFSFTAQGQPWTAHEWLAQLGIYGVYAAGGYGGLMLALGLVSSLIFIGVYLLCWMETKNVLAAFLGGLTAWFFGTVSLAARPLLLGHLFLVAELLILELARRRSRRWLWCLPPLFAVWANCHGSYYFGLGVIGVYWLSSFLTGEWGAIESRAWDAKGRKTLTAVLFLSVAAVCCTPVGVRLLLYPLKTIFQQRGGLNASQEWLPPDPREIRAVAMLLGIGAILLAAAARKMTLQLRELALILVAFALAIEHTRMLFLFGIVAAPALARLIAAVVGPDRGRDHPVANAILMLACAAAMIAWFPSAAGLRDQVRKSSPQAAVEYIRRAGLPGPMLNEYVFGGYLIWAFPEQKVFIDGRSDVYEWTGVLEEFGRWATLSEDPAVLLDKRGIRLCILASGGRMTYVMPRLPGWRKAYADDVASVYVR